jgi:cystathionine beta-lyase family protein involved in aluminum resistance
MMHTDWINEAEVALSQDVWPALEATGHSTFKRVLDGFRLHKVGAHHLASVSGYGHDDMGREVTDHVFAHALQAESALVRGQIVSGTHALAVALNGVLGHGDTLLSLTGRPYDTLEQVLGLRGNSAQSLKARGVSYQQINILDTPLGLAEYLQEHATLIQQATVGYIQRSRGYSLRPALSIATIKALIDGVKAINPSLIVLVDNCYGEFTEANEPTHVGADLMAGSLIKNPGGGLVAAGGYVAGKTHLVDACADVLTCPGVGRWGGYTFEQTRLILQGLFMAPSVVKDALKGMTFAAWMFSKAGFQTFPQWDDYPRSDIIQVLQLGSADKLVTFCQTLQGLSPMDSAITPIPATVPGYADPVVMAGGTFIEGSTIELSADGPLREPYTAFFQGGLSYAHVRLAVTEILDRLH